MAERYIMCPDCGQPMLPVGEVKRPNEYDHASGCPGGHLVVGASVLVTWSGMQRGRAITLERMSGAVTYPPDQYGRWGVQIGTRSKPYWFMREALSSPAPRPADGQRNEEKT